MFLDELSGWIDQQRRDKNIPGSATIDCIDVGSEPVEMWEMHYNPEDNTIQILTV